MKLKRLEKRAHPETIIALIDVVFFLLVFFLLVGRMDATAPFELIPPLAASGADMPGGGSTISVAATGQLALNGQSIDKESLFTALEEVVRQDATALVRINADRTAPLQFVLPLVSQIEVLGVGEVVLVVTPADAP